jgi:3-phosphoshikimate 1-carboxyvinyltransferase
VAIHPQSFVAHPVDRVGGDITVPGDKSISHRALMLGAIATGRSRVDGFLAGEDCIATRTALEKLGVVIRDLPTGALEIDGVGPAGLRPSRTVLDLGNSGTAIRLMTGLLAAQPFDTELTGDASLQRRPMERVAAPLRLMGASIDTTEGKPPLTIRGGRLLRGIDYALPIASAQVKSALLLAALFASGRTTLRSPGPSRDHTERMLASMGARVEVDADTHTVSLTGPVELAAADVRVPADFSSAAFFIVAGCLGADAGLLIRNVGVNPTRIGLLTILEAMGARIALHAQRSLGAEPVADIRVERSELRGIEVPPELVPLAIDEFPILFVAAAAARGVTTVRGAAELRTKETDRIATMAEALAGLGARVRESADGLTVDGGRLDGGRVDARGDHRIAMSFAVASLIARGAIEILNTTEVATSFPGFVDCARSAGLAIDTRGDAH